jgi:hypothetical protein
MPRAILRDGVIYPTEPLPPEWEDGQEVWVDTAPSDSSEELDRWREELEAQAARISPEDIKRLEAALAEADKQAKDMVRREMGLP